MVVTSVAEVTLTVASLNVRPAFKRNVTSEASIVGFPNEVPSDAFPRLSQIMRKYQKQYSILLHQEVETVKH